MRRHLGTAFMAFLPFLVLCGCATYDRPTMIKPSVIKVGDLVAYKRLTRDDFRASSPPGSITAANRAALCTQIVLSPEVRIQISLNYTGNGPPQYRATLADPKFYAVANRACSWWNAGTENNEEILEHEQVHFAIAELAARELNRRAAEITRVLRSTGDTPAEAIAGIRGDFFVRVRRSFLEQDQKFDEEMWHLFASRARQRQWLKRVEAKLLDTQVYAEGPSREAQVAQIHERSQVQGIP